MKFKTAAIIALNAITFATASPNASAAEKPADTYLSSEIIELCEEAGAEHNICPELIEAIIEHESSGIADAKNGTCIGLMQVSETYHIERMHELGYDDLTDPKANIATGTDLLAELFEEYEDTAVVLMRYNGTKDAVKRATEGRITGYAESIMERSEQLERIHGK